MGMREVMNGSTKEIQLIPCPRCGTCSLKTQPGTDLCADVIACATFSRTKETYGGTPMPVKGPNDDDD